jgi:hypothetical protein
MNQKLPKYDLPRASLAADLEQELAPQAGLWEEGRLAEQIGHAADRYYAGDKGWIITRWTPLTERGTAMHHVQRPDDNHVFETVSEDQAHAVAGALNALEKRRIG